MEWLRGEGNEVVVKVVVGSGDRLGGEGVGAGCVWGGEKEIGGRRVRYRVVVRKWVVGGSK